MHVRQALSDAGRLQQVPVFVSIDEQIFTNTFFREHALENRGIRNNVATNESTCSYQGSD